MTPEEQKVLNVLINHQGKYLQKYVVKEAGLSRLKTHRVVAGSSSFRAARHRNS